MGAEKSRCPGRALLSCDGCCDRARHKDVDCRAGPSGDRVARGDGHRRGQRQVDLQGSIKHRGEGLIPGALTLGTNSPSRRLRPTRRSDRRRSRLTRLPPRHDSARPSPQQLPVLDRSSEGGVGEAVDGDYHLLHAIDRPARPQHAVPHVRGDSRPTMRQLTSGAAQESNLPTHGLHALADFEDRMGHRARATPGAGHRTERRPAARPPAG
jgi:hypothetical protein